MSYWKCCPYCLGSHDIWRECKSIDKGPLVPGPAPHQLSSDKVATVSNEVFWKRIDENTPHGTKVWLISKPAGSATQGHYNGDSFWTHWFPLPRFSKDEDET